MYKISERRGDKLIQSRAIVDNTWQRRQELSLHPATATAAETEDWHGRSMQSDKGSSAQVS